MTVCSVGRMGSSLSVLDMCRFGSMLSALAFMHLGFVVVRALIHSGGLAVVYPGFLAFGRLAIIA